MKSLFFVLFVAISYNLIGQTQDIAIKEVPVDAADFLPNNNFIGKKLAHILSSALKAKNKAFDNESCLGVENLGTGGGYNTLQVFLVSSTCTGKAEKYIVKEPPNGLSEINHLKIVANSPKVNDLALPHIVAGLPSLALPISYLAYEKNSKKHYLIIMPAAPGKDLAFFITQFRDQPSASNKAILSKAFMTLGEELGKFHKRNMQSDATHILNKTITHGDFHQFNIFYDPEKNHIVFIDNESIARSITTPDQASSDIIKLFFMPFSINSNYEQFRILLRGIDLKTWFDISLRNFLIGYLKAYPKDKQQKVLQELQNIFMLPFAPITWIDFNEGQLNSIRKDYFLPIFDALKIGLSPK